MEWISVKDRLPFDDMDVSECGIIDSFIVYFDDGEYKEVGHADFIRSQGDPIGEWYYPSGEKHTFWADKITHWMPLPQPSEE
jgi:hypothetical protein